MTSLAEQSLAEQKLDTEFKDFINKYENANCFVNIFNTRTQNKPSIDDILNIDLFDYIYGINNDEKCKDVGMKNYFK